MAVTLPADFEVDPISRIEGHLGVKVSVAADGTISEANAHGNLWRGFENFLIGRRANDAITFTQRICGVCPVPHGTAATFAADSVLGVSSGYATFSSDQLNYSDGVPEAALHVRNIVLAAEFLMSSITHFYHLVAQSYVQGPPVPPWTPYFKDGQYHPLLRVGGDGTLPKKGSNGYSADLWSAVITQYVKALRIRRLTFEAGAMFAGRMPMMSMAVAGGTTNTFKSRADFDAKVNTFRNLISEVGLFVVQEYLPLTLALGFLYPDFDNKFNAGKKATDPDVGAGYGSGAGLGNFLAWGGFPQADGTMGINGGWVVDASNPTATDHVSGDLLTNRSNLSTAIQAVKDNLKEFIERSRYADPLKEFSAAGDGTGSAYPGKVTRTVPERDLDSKYSWMKAPRWNGYAMEVGPLARMVINAKYLVDGSVLVDQNGNAAQKIYAAVYGTSDTASYNSNGIDLRVLHPDLVSGLVASGHAADVTSYIAGLKGGLSTMDRLRGRAIESVWMIVSLLGAPSKNATTGALSFAGGGWIDKLQGLGGANVPNFYRDTTPPTGTVSGFGLVEAPRGALGHFITATNGKINSYQCVVPTTWNGSPKNGATTGSLAPHQNTSTNRGAIEQAMIGAAFDGNSMVSTDGAHVSLGRVSGVEVLRIAQSFDPCIACAVH